MLTELSPVRLCVLAFVSMMWIVFGLVFALHKRPPKAPEVKRDSASRWGIALQGAAYAVSWALPRRHYMPISPTPRWAEMTFAAVTVALTVASIWLSVTALRTLGKQWATVARIVEGHQLVTQGPYSWVRNPIYLAMFGMLLATELVWSRWWVILIAVTVFLIGNEIRIRSEEKILRETFGERFKEYARRVPAFFPRLF